MSRGRQSATPSFVRTADDEVPFTKRTGEVGNSFPAVLEWHSHFFPCVCCYVINTGTLAVADEGSKAVSAVSDFRKYHPSISENTTPVLLKIPP